MATSEVTGDVRGPDPAQAPLAEPVRVELPGEATLERLGPDCGPQPGSQSADGTPDGFPAIADYGFVSDCENTALVAPDGSVEWLCLPRPHDPSVFGATLDRSAGRFRVGPADTVVPSGRRYHPGTLILETTWQARTGWLIVHDFLAVGPWHRTADRSALHRRVPGDADAEHLLVRLVTCVHGSVDLDVICEPMFDYGQNEAAWVYDRGDYSVLRSVDGPVGLCLASNLRFGLDAGAARVRHRLKEGERCFVTLGWSDRPPPGDTDSAWQALADTGEFWRTWLERGTFPDHVWRNALQRSALTLKGLSYAPSGALLAAPTTSLPEHPGGERNWDYRYSWTRDSAMALWGLHAIGLDDEADDFMAFLADAVLTPSEANRLTLPSNGGRHTDLHVLYPVDGTAPAETVLDHLGGYAGARPVRSGNAAESQSQHDIFGAVVDCVYQHTRSRDKLTERVWQLVVPTVETALAVWDKPDQGIWEMRTEPRHFVHSKVMCWVAADRGGRLAQLRGELGLAEKWAQAAATIHADICAHGLNESGVFTQSYGSANLDASVLLLPLVRFLPADDPRLRATVLAVGEELTDHGLILRYRTDETDDGVNGAEATFTLCSFWYVSALVEIGEVDRARRMCERLLGLASPLGLYAEELDPATGRHWGNFPQAFTHLALINAVAHIVRAEQAEILKRHQISWE